MSNVTRLPTSAENATRVVSRIRNGKEFARGRRDPLVPFDEVPDHLNGLLFPSTAR